MPPFPQDDFLKSENSADKVSNVLFSSHTDGAQHTLIAYAQSASNINKKLDDDSTYNFVVMESFLPGFNAANQAGKGGVFSMLSKAPVFIGVAMFAVFYMFFKGKRGGGMGGGGGGGGGMGGFGNSPLGRLGKIFMGGRSSRRGSRYGRGGRGGGVGGSKMDRWQAKHGGPSSRQNMSANMRYGQRQQTNMRQFSSKSSSRPSSGKRRFSGGSGGSLYE